MKSRSIVLYNPFGWRASKGVQYRGRRRASAVRRVLCQLVTIWLSLSLSTSDCASTSEGLPGLERLRGRTGAQRNASFNPYNAAASSVESLSEKAFKDQRHVYEIAEQPGNADESSDKFFPSLEGMRVSKDGRPTTAEDEGVLRKIPFRKPSRDPVRNNVESQLNPLQSSPPHRSRPVLLHPPHPVKKKTSRYAYAASPSAVELQPQEVPLPQKNLQGHGSPRLWGHAAFGEPERMRMNHTSNTEEPVSPGGGWPIGPGGFVPVHITNQTFPTPQVHSNVPPLRGRKTLLAAALLYMTGWVSLSTTLVATALGTYKVLKSREERQDALRRTVGR